MKDDKRTLVSIQCLVYNHEKYLRDCLDGIVSQRTDFRFEAVVHDDCSTDHSADIIREYATKYPNIIKPIYETENQYSKHDGSLKRIMNTAMKGKYTAFCEGDDYWIDPTKLQRQVDFLETHPDYSLCWTDAFEETEGNKKPYHRYPDDCDSPLEDIILKGGLFIPTCSIVARRSVLDDMPEEARHFYIGDYPMQIWLGYKGKCRYLKEQTCVYRYMSHGSWTERQNRTQSDEELRQRYKNEVRIYDTFDSLFHFQYHELFQKRKIDFLFQLLLAAGKYKELRPYMRLRGEQFALDWNHCTSTDLCLQSLGKLLDIHQETEGKDARPIKVAVCNLVYNQERFVRQCFEGFVSQRTDFRFVVITHDDCSTDHTADIVREYASRYPDLFHLIYEEENQYSKGKDSQLKRKVEEAIRLTGCKYIAMCEGDDYWTDPYKLQKQVDFLDSHPSYSMCFHAAEIIKEDSSLETSMDTVPIEERDYKADELFLHWVVPTASMVMRQEAYFYRNGLKGAHRAVNGDIVLVLSCCALGKVHAFKDKMSVYRVHSGGVTYDPKRQRNRILGYPQHFLFIKENFKGVVSRKAADLWLYNAYLMRMQVDTGFHKLLDLWNVFKYKVLCFIEKRFS